LLAACIVVVVVVVLVSSSGGGAAAAAALIVGVELYFKNSSYLISRKSGFGLCGRYFIGQHEKAEDLLHAIIHN
jgi:hypothetical protein